MRFVRFNCQSLCLRLLKCIALAIFGVLSATSICLAEETNSFIKAQYYWVGENPDCADSVLWKAFDGPLSLGFGTQPLWIKLQVASSPDQSATTPIEINIQPSFLDQIDLYDPLQASNPPKGVGDQFPLFNNARPALTYNFQVEAGKEPRNILLRIKTSSSRLLSITALPLADALVADRNILTATNLLLFGIFLFVPWAFFNWAIRKDTLSRGFAILQLFAFLYGIFILGYARLYLSTWLSAPAIDSLTSIFVILYTYISIWVFLALMITHHLSKSAQRFFRLWLSTGLIVVTLYSTGYPWLALKINASVAVTSCLFFFLAAVFSIPWRSLPEDPALLPKKVLITYQAVFLAINLVTLLSILDLGIPVRLSMYGSAQNGLLTGLLLATLLYIRNRNIDRGRDQQIAISATNAQNERQQREQQEQFMDMLAHEIKTPLSIISLALDQNTATPRLRDIANRGVSNINAVLSRCLQVNKLTEASHAIHSKLTSIQSLVAELITNQPDSKRFQLTCPENVEIQADETLLRIAISNLMDNALKYGAPQSIIQIVIEPDTEEKHALNIAVSNEVGPTGTPDPAQLFKKYYRSPNAHRQTGSGLGLYLSRSIAQMHNGDIHYTSNSHSVCFQITLPFTPN